MNELHTDRTREEIIIMLVELTGGEAYMFEDYTDEQLMEKYLEYSSKTKNDSSKISGLNLLNQAQSYASLTEEELQSLIDTQNNDEA